MLKGMPNKIGNVLVGLENDLILLGDKLALLREKLGVANKGEVNLVVGVMAKSKLTTDVGWV